MTAKPVPPDDYAAAKTRLSAVQGAHDPKVSKAARQPKNVLDDVDTVRAFEYDAEVARAGGKVPKP